MCKVERKGKMPIIFDDDSQMFFNTGFIDELASLLRVGGYVPDKYKNVILKKSKSGLGGTEEKAYY